MFSAVVSLRRHFDFGRAVMKHTHALALAFFGGLIVCAPQWIVPLLPGEYARAVDTLSHRLAEPHTYWELAITWFLVNLFYACFLAWNEERDEVIRLSPVLTYNFLGYETDEHTCKFRLEIINGGAQTSIGEWGCRCVLENNRALSLSDHYFTSEPSADEQGVNLFTDTSLIKQGGRRKGWVKFRRFPECRAIEVTFHDHTGTSHIVSSAKPPRVMKTELRKETTK